MKASFALPIFAQAAQDDTSTLLSLKVQTTLETGVDHLLDAVGSRNVTQMSSLLQNLVEETIDQGETGPNIDDDVKQALLVIKSELLANIRGALNEAHCYDQQELHVTIQNFQHCETTRSTEEASCTDYCDGSAHKECRDGLLVKYQAHITECRALDSFMKDFEAECPKAEKRCCLLSHTTWNCGGLCSGQIANLDVDGYFGTWLSEQITKFETAYHQWMALHASCTAAFHAYVETDAKCDCMQADCETNNCAFETCHWMACEDNYQRCWARMLVEWERTNTAKECLEKDRKIDWSATEKIECYVDVLLASPSKDELLAKCGTEDCYSKYREIMYKHCNTICPEVDFVAGEDKLSHVRRVDDQDITEEGENDVRTKHRTADGQEGGRCTAHLDLDYQLTPCCTPCEERPQPPCGPQGDYTGGWDKNSYMWLHYGKYGHFDASDIADFDADTCHSGEHTYVYGYNLCTCLDCPDMPYPPTQVCPGSSLAPACSYPAKYDYSVHDVKVECSEVSDVVVTPYATNHGVEEE